MKKTIVIMLVIGCLLTTSLVSVNAAPQEETHTMDILLMEADFYVDDDAPNEWYDNPTHFRTIRTAVDHAKKGYTIYVRSGLYDEDAILVDEEIKLIGHSKETTFIRSMFWIQKTQNVVVKGFTFQHIDYDKFIEDEFLIEQSSKCTVTENRFEIYDAGNFYYGIVISMYSTDNIISNNEFEDLDSYVSTIGIQVEIWSTNNLIYQNEVNNLDYGITCLMSNENKIIANNISYNKFGVNCGLGDSNLIYYNNFIDNIGNALDTVTGLNIYHKNGIGNYWSDYDEPSEGAYDDNDDGIVDSPYSIPIYNMKGKIVDYNYDNYPLMEQVDIYSIEI